MCSAVPFALRYSLRNFFATNFLMFTHTLFGDSVVITLSFFRYSAPVTRKQFIGTFALLHLLLVWVPFIPLTISTVILSDPYTDSAVFGLIMFLAGILLYIPWFLMSLSLHIRRLKTLNQSVGFIAFYFILYLVLFIICLAKDPEPTGTNQPLNLVSNGYQNNAPAQPRNISEHPNSFVPSQSGYQPQHPSQRPQPSSYPQQQPRQQAQPVGYPRQQNPYPAQRPQPSNPYQGSYRPQVPPAQDF